jgi:hypothetical protein
MLVVAAVHAAVPSWGFAVVDVDTVACLECRRPKGRASHVVGGFRRRRGAGCRITYSRLVVRTSSHSLFVRVRALFVRCSYEFAYAVRALFVRCSYAVRTSANSPANYTTRPSVQLVVASKRWRVTSPRNMGMELKRLRYTPIKLGRSRCSCSAKLVDMSCSCEATSILPSLFVSIHANSSTSSSLSAYVLRNRTR